MPEIYTLIGEISVDEQEQFQLLSKAITLHPQSPIPYIRRGKIFQEKGKVLDALSDFAVALQIDPSQTEIYQWIDDILAYLGDEISLHGHDPSVHALRAQAYMKLDRYEAALVDWLAALEIDPSNALLIRGLADCQLRSGQTSRAWESLGKAITKYPLLPELRLDRAKISLSLMEIDQAEEDLIEAINQDASIGEAHFLRGQIFVSREAWLEAETHFATASQLGFEQPELFRQLALIALQKDELEESLRYFDKGISLGINEDILIDAAHVSKALGETEKCLKYVETLLTHWPHNQEGWELKAHIHEELAQNDQALKAYMNLAQLNPMSLEPWEKSTYLAAGLGRWKDALNAVSRLFSSGAAGAEALKIRG